MLDDGTEQRENTIMQPRKRSRIARIMMSVVITRFSESRPVGEALFQRGRHKDRRKVTLDDGRKLI